MVETDDESGASHGSVRNVVLVVLDTARATRFEGVAGDGIPSRFASIDDRTMPTLADVGMEGTVFERAFSTAPWTLPSHASLFTGTYPSEHGAHGGHTYLDDSLRTLPEAFAAAGYETVGVSNNTWITSEFGFDRGFDELRRGWQYVQSDVDMGTVVRGEDVAEKLSAARDRLLEGNPVVNAANVLYSEFLQPAGDDGAARTTDWIGDWLAGREDDRPFFLFCNYIEPHVEYDPPRAFAERYLPDDATVEEAREIRQDPRGYDVGDYEITDREFDLLRGLYRAECAYVDSQLERLRESLRAAGEWEESLVVVCGDHGEHVGDHGFFGHQYNLYDTLTHVPLVVTGGPFTGGGRREDLVSLLDLPATLPAVAGIEDPLAEQGHGRSLLASGERDAVFAEYVSPQPSIERLEDRFGKGAIPERVRAFDRRLRAVRTGGKKYVAGDDGFERYHDLTEDPREREDLAEERPARAGALAARLEERFGGLTEAEASGSVSMAASTEDRLADLGYL
ncbi:sulfatase [Saliphagus infecundisoli]|uniref:Sulfatase n=1 Tax=Saliphagus infecundisoli TaxID=1849069 RepID=A0ABD5QIW4_9EURY|nr:sulfatase [Saliphagus infecundisoli]